MPQTTPTPAAGPHDALWQRLRSHPFDDPADARPFSARLRQATGWSAAHTRRVLEEYRRFLYLTQQLRGRACPSEAVDAAWHAHLLDSSRYFGDFCPRVLGRVLHHHPSRGGADGARHRAHYAATLRAYARAFGAPPPADLWPAADQRFAERVRQVSSRTHWVLAKPRWWRRPAFPAKSLRAWGMALCLPALVVAGCTQGRIPLAAGGTLTGPQFLGHYLLAMAVLLAVGILLAVRGRRAGVPLRAEGLDPIDQAYLAGGTVRVLWTAMVGMLQRGQVRLDQVVGRWVAVAAPGAEAHAVERALYAPLARGVQPREALAEAQGPLDALHDRLHARGLLTHTLREGRGTGWAERLYQAAWTGLLLWGVLRVAQGWHRGYPVGGLLVLMAIALLLKWAFGRALPHRLTREARTWISSARRALPRTRELGAADPVLPLALALLGATVLGDELAAVRQALAPVTPGDGGGSGCGAGCDGGGDGGGGCGGCGD